MSEYLVNYTASTRRKQLNYCTACKKKLNNTEKATNYNAGLNEATGYYCIVCGFQKLVSYFDKNTRTFTKVNEK